ncbi:MAG: LacI family DNA-binding transcriptional regulator [Anaerolineae bacterium]|nr:LacI family DNA-binding transcriptional regulator [Anaerolineae bacterium]
MTVSRVVNGKDGISDATRQHIQRIIDELGYRPSNIARGLVTKRTGTIGLIVPDNTNPFFSEIARGAEHEAYAEGYNVFLCNTEENCQRELAVLQLLEEKCVDGIVLCSSRLDDEALHDALDHHAAVVLINRPLDRADISLLRVDDEQGGWLATRHLLETGHRAISILTGPEVSFSARGRLAGYYAAMRAAGLEPDPGWIQQCLPVVEDGRNTARALLTAHPEVTALFCYNDLVAVGAIQACQSLGRAIPEDVAIVGFDDISLAALVTPALTTCHVPQYQMGSQAMRLLLNQIEGCPESCEDIIMQPELVVRASAP